MAMVRYGSTYRLSQDGTLLGSALTDTSNVLDLSGVLYISTFNNSSGNNNFTGWMDEFRISKGIARWTANFTPPISEYGARGYWYE